MKTHMQVKGRGMPKVSPQQVIYELKHKVVLALNKLADRDTYQIAVDELEKTVECLTPDGIAPFLSCILDTDSEQKSVVRKECVRLIGAVVRFHDGFIGSHVGKMVASIVKRLKDPDSVVRDACVETMGVLALKLTKHEYEGHGVFVSLVRPLFETIGEQNKQVQAGAALCLARVIDHTHDPPVGILQKMLSRTIKLLKNPHFIAKPAVIELNRSIIQAGGAPSQSVLTAAMASIQEALKNSDWTTRKAASVALGEIASSGGSLVAFLKASCVRSLESCRFDKVKPVRDTALHALQYWKSLPGPDASEPSETGSAIKENFCGGDYSDLTSLSDSGRKNITFKNVNMDSVKRSIPLSTRKTRQNYMETSQVSKSDDWHIEIAVPKTRNVSLVDLHNEESEVSSVTKTTERMSIDVTSIQDTAYECVPMDDKQECSSVSNLDTDKVADNFGTKFMTISSECVEDSFMEPVSRNQRFAAEGIICDEQLYNPKMQDRRSLDSTVTESSSQAVPPVHGCCSQIGNEMVLIRKQLLDVQNKQSNLMDLLQVFSTGVIDSLSTLQSKVLGLQQAVDRMSQDIVHPGRSSDFVSSKIGEQRSSISSPRLSTSTPRPSVDMCNRQPSVLPGKSSDEQKSFGRSWLASSAKPSAEMWSNSMTKISRNSMGKDIQKNSGQGSQMRNTEPIFAYAESGLNNSVRNNGLWLRIKGFLSEGDLDSAYVAALRFNDELVLIQLLNITGPVLENLSHKTVNDVLSALSSYVLEQRYINYIIPWFQQVPSKFINVVRSVFHALRVESHGQSSIYAPLVHLPAGFRVDSGPKFVQGPVVDLTTIHGPNNLAISMKTKREFLFAIQEAVAMEFSNPAERRSITQLAMRLRQVWGKCG